VGAREARITLHGRVAAPDGVAEVTVNGQAAALESDGAFIVGVTLEAGDTPLVVVAVDTQGQGTERAFTLSRPKGAGGVPAPGSEQRRVALLIGNATYKVSPLRNATHDASDMEEALKKLGFETTLLRDAKFQQMENAINDFRRKLQKGGVG